MSISKFELQDRRDKILAIAIERYIETISPVSSGYIAEKSPYRVSSATIRNILSELEEKGLLTHPHTSAGRVPTQRGYRYYVDNLMDEIHLLNAEKERVRFEYREATKELDQLLEKTSSIISDLTHYTSIISVDGCADKLICRGTNFVVNYPDYEHLKKVSDILSALEEKERLYEIINRQLKEKIDIYIGHEMQYKEVDSCSLVVSGYRTQRGVSGRIAVLGPQRMYYEKVISTIEYVSEVIEDIL